MEAAGVSAGGGGGVEGGVGCCRLWAGQGWWGGTMDMLNIAHTLDKFRSSLAQVTGIFQVNISPCLEKKKEGRVVSERQRHGSQELITPWKVPDSTPDDT